jgi:hypothetical protein
MAPQSVRPSPMKARTCEFVPIEKASASIPGTRKAMPMAVVREMSTLTAWVLVFCSSVLCSTGFCTIVGCSKVDFCVFVAGALALLWAPILTSRGLHLRLLYGLKARVER